MLSLEKLVAHCDEINGAPSQASNDFEAQLDTSAPKGP